MIGRIVKRLLHRLIRGLIARPIRGVIMLAVLLMAAGVLAAQSIDPRALPDGLPSFGMPSFAARGSGSPPAATETYMKGTETFNAELVWSALSEEALSRYRNRGGSPQSMQAQMEQAKQAGQQVGDVTYIGGQALPDGTSLHFYTVLARGSQSRSDGEYVPYVFTLDRSGKISRVQ